MNFTENDIKQIESKGLTLEMVNAQIDLFKQGLPYVNLKKAATIDSGIIALNEQERDKAIGYFQSVRDNIKIIKFVPASGAATRMFKFLFQFLEEYQDGKERVNAYINQHKASAMTLFYVGLEKFPFYQEVLDYLREKDPNYDNLKRDEQLIKFVHAMLDEDKLNLSAYPKGLLPFHKYKDHNASAFEEHLFEGALYASSNQSADLHFTIAQIHNHKFDEEFKRIEEIVEEKTGTAFEISFSFQKTSTDTIAVDLNNKPFRDEDGSLLFRPSGHGALLDNLNTLDADLVFIKNIDNVVVSKYEAEVAEYKKMLGGVLLELQNKVFHYLKLMDEKDLEEEEIISIAEFLVNGLNIDISPEFEKYSKKYQLDYIKQKLNRPIRVCGMVKNEGEPGGGPFWVKNESGTVSLQIVESAQVDKKNKTQKSILKNSTHFNPVDIVCGIRDYQGRKFDLSQFVDQKTAFISEKTQNGKELKALELPGLWNGSMANWTTIFVEVPLLTFNPVKTVNDLLKPQHQSSKK